jgi:surface antigen
VIDLASFISKYLGVPNTGDNSVNTGQCTGLVEVWLDANKQPHIYGNAKDLPANAPALGYKVVANGPTNFPAPGNIVCWNSSWGGGMGHTAIVVAANADQLVVFEQNDPTGHAPTVATHDYTGIEGWITF